MGDGDQRFHEDCWSAARPAVIAQQADQQRDYEKRIASDGLAALLSPYVTVLPAQRSADQPAERASADPAAGTGQARATV